MNFIHFNSYCQLSHSNESEVVCDTNIKNSMLVDSFYEILLQDVEKLKQNSIKQDSISVMNNKKDIFRKKIKNVAVITSLVVLQITFGFDPKFTAINLVWLFL